MPIEFSENHIDEENPLWDLANKLWDMYDENDEPLPIMVHIDQGNGKFVQGRIDSIEKNDDAIWLNGYDVHQT